MTRTGDREIRSVSGRLPDNPGELACMVVNGTLSGRLFVRGENGANVRPFVRCANVFTLSSDSNMASICLWSYFFCPCHRQSSS